MSRGKVRRWFAPVLAWSLCQATVLVDRTTLADQFYPSVVSRSDREKQIVAKLHVEVRDFAFFETPLSDFVEMVADTHHIPVAIDTAALEGTGLDPTIPVTIELSGISLRAALHRTLTPLGLTYAVRDEVLLITTSDSRNAFEVRCYGVGQLLSGDRSSDELVASLSSILDGSIVGNFEGFGEEGYGGRPGGGAASGRRIATFGNVLIVRDTTRGHEQIGTVLASLRDVLRVGGNASQAESGPDVRSRRPSVGRLDPGRGGARRTVDSPRQGGDDPFAEPHDARFSDDPFRDVDEPGGSDPSDPFGGPAESGDASSDNPPA